MSIWVAYNSYGDLIASVNDRWSLEIRIDRAGYDIADVLIGRVK